MTVPSGKEMPPRNFSVYILDSNEMEKVRRAAKRAKIKLSKFVFKAAVREADRILKSA